MSTTDLTCSNEGRREEVRKTTLFGLDYVEVSDDQLTLEVFFLGRAPQKIERVNVRITGTNVVATNQGTVVTQFAAVPETPAVEGATTPAADASATPAAPDAPAAPEASTTPAVATEAPAMSESAPEAPTAEEKPSTPPNTTTENV